MNEEESWLENRTAKKISADCQPSYRDFLGSGGNWLAAAPDGMAFFHPVLIRW